MVSSAHISIDMVNKTNLSEFIGSSIFINLLSILDKPTQVIQMLQWKNFVSAYINPNYQYIVSSGHILSDQFDKANKSELIGWKIFINLRKISDTSRWMAQGRIF